MSTLAKAISLASDVFINKKDKAGQPYILHCIRVMNNLCHDADDELKIIAMLHDVVEDTAITDDNLREMGFSTRVLQAVASLTHDKEEDYMEYVKKLAYNSDARQVKMADLRDNSDITRLKGLTKKDLDRMQKYHTAYTYLKDV